MNNNYRHPNCELVEEYIPRYYVVTEPNPILPWSRPWQRKRRNRK
nr:hypothetical protein K-LCC10_0329 [Kaumoebavirus]